MHDKRWLFQLVPDSLAGTSAMRGSPRWGRWHCWGSCRLKFVNGFSACEYTSAVGWSKDQALRYGSSEPSFIPLPLPRKSAPETLIKSFVRGFHIRTYIVRLQLPTRVMLDRQKQTQDSQPQEWLSALRESLAIYEHACCMRCAGQTLTKPPSLPPVQSLQNANSLQTWKGKTDKSRGQSHYWLSEQLLNGWYRSRFFESAMLSRGVYRDLLSSHHWYEPGIRRWAQ